MTEPLVWPRERIAQALGCQIENELICRKDLARGMGLSLTVFDKLRYDQGQGFPDPFYIGEKSDPLWWRRDVNEWIENKRKSAKITSDYLQDRPSA